MSRTLPPEILCDIFDLINPDNRRTLLSMCLVSRLFHTIVEPLLYADVKFSAANAAAVSRRLEAFRRTIAADDGRLAVNVKSFSVVAPVFPPTPAKGYAAKVDGVLPHLVNLKSLKFDCLHRPPVFFHTLSPSRCPFALRTFVWTNPITDAEAITAFLESQPSIEHLELGQVEDELKLSSQALPRLRRLSAPLVAAVSILPGRDVTELALYSHADLEPNPLLDEAISRIQFLYREGSLQEYAAITSHLHNLRWLKIVATERVPIDYVLNELVEVKAERLQYLQLGCDGPPSSRRDDIMREIFDMFVSILTGRDLTRRVVRNGTSNIGGRP